MMVSRLMLCMCVLVCLTVSVFVFLTQALCRPNNRFFVKFSDGALVSAQGYSKALVDCDSGHSCGNEFSRAPSMRLWFLSVSQATLRVRNVLLPFRTDWNLWFLMSSSGLLLGRKDAWVYISFKSLLVEAPVRRMASVWAKSLQTVECATLESL